MYNGKKISAVIPCYNEEEGITELLKDKPVFMDEVIVVDNNSNDRTSDAAAKYGARIVYLKKRGYGLAYQAGLPESSGDIVVMLDGDNSHSITDAEKLLIYMEKENCDFISGCRFPLENKGDMPIIKRMSNYFISWLAKVILRVNLADSQSGMCVFKRALLPEIMPQNRGMGFSQELKLNAWLNPRIKSCEMRIKYRKRVGRVKFRAIRDSLEVCRDLLIFIWRKRLR